MKYKISGFSVKTKNKNHKRRGKLVKLQNVCIFIPKPEKLNIEGGGEFSQNTSFVHFSYL